MNGYNFINHGMLSAFMEKWNSKTSSFHLPTREMSITLDDVSSLLHLTIKGRLLHHSIISRPNALDMMVLYLRVDPGDAQKEMDDTRGCHTRFGFL